MENTSKKNREILQKVRTLGPAGYLKFKECLVASEQKYLADYLTELERENR